jgi:hypothetical protein
MIADADRDGKRFVVHADEKLTAFLELEKVIRLNIGGKCSDATRHRPLGCTAGAAEVAKAFLWVKR